jgi:hypothetical protein
MANSRLAPEEDDEKHLQRKEKTERRWGDTEEIGR